MAKKKAKRSGFETSDDYTQCAGCERAHDVKLGGWVILATGHLICDPVDHYECWEKIHDTLSRDTFDTAQRTDEVSG